MAIANLCSSPPDKSSTFRSFTLIRSNEGMKGFIQQQIEHILFMNISCQTYGKGPLCMRKPAATTTRATLSN